jgi:hypothetical protein
LTLRFAELQEWVREIAVLLLAFDLHAYYPDTENPVPEENLGWCPESYQPHLFLGAIAVCFSPWKLEQAYSRMTSAPKKI